VTEILQPIDTKVYYQILNITFKIELCPILSTLRHYPDNNGYYSINFKQEK